MLRSIVATIYCLGLLLIGSGVGGTIKSSVPRAPDRSHLRYIIVSNQVIDDSGRPPRAAYRYIEAFIDEKAFSQKNLKTLFTLIAKRYAKPRVLHVQVYTNLQEVETPEEREEPKVSETESGASSEETFQAFYLRDSRGNEWFRYNPTIASTVSMTVVLKGIDPQTPRR